MLLELLAGHGIGVEAEKGGNGTKDQRGIEHGLGLNGTIGYRSAFGCWVPMPPDDPSGGRVGPLCAPHPVKVRDAPERKEIKAL